LKALKDLRTLRVVCWNVEHGGFAGHLGGDSGRRRRAHEILRGYAPHIVLRQEMTHGHADGARLLHQEAAALGLTGLIAPATPESPNPTAVMYDPAVFALAAEYQHVTAGWYPICNPVVVLRGDQLATRPLSLASVHLCAHSPTIRATEARRLAVALGTHGRTAILGGDFNSYPHRTAYETVPLPDWTTIPDPVHYQVRTVTTSTGTRTSDTQPDEILCGTTPNGRRVFTDLAHTAAALGQPGALAATANLHRTDQGVRSRIDRMYATPDLAPALRSLRVDDTVTDASDHALLIAEFDFAAFRNALTLR
jgi:endonuclease/exonuclease/phosphatase family metal-dependent hydrolase